MDLFVFCVVLGIRFDTKFEAFMDSAFLELLSGLLILNSISLCIDY